MHRVHWQQQMMRMWLNHGQMKCSKLSMMRLWGFTGKHIVISSRSLQIWLPWFSSPLLIVLKIQDRVWQVSWLTETEPMDQYRVRTTRNIHWNILLCEDSSRQSHDESIRIWWKKSILGVWGWRSWWQFRLLGRGWRRWRWRIPGCLRRCVLDLGWEWLPLVSKKISRKKNEKRKGKKNREKAILLKMKVIGLKMIGKEMKQKIGMKASGPKKMKQHGNPKAGMNGKEIPMMSMDTSKEKEGKERKERTGKERWGNGRSRKRTRWWERWSKLC